MVSACGRGGTRLCVCPGACVSACMHVYAGVSTVVTNVDALLPVVIV